MALRRNDFALCHTVLSDIGKGKLPAHIRFNSFGELIDSTHAQNVCKIAETFPATQFTLWTKRPELLFYAGALPNNLSVIYSYPLLNPSEGDLNTIQCNAARHWPFISAIYAVYDKDSGVPPCGTKCLDCLKCYPPVKLPDGRPSIIKQRLH
jgi:hypothetical protein